MGLGASGNTSSTVTLTPQQARQIASAGRGMGGSGSLTPVYGPDGATVTGYTMPSSVYSGLYSTMSQNGLITRGSDLPTPGEATQSAAQSESQSTGISPLAPIAAPPSSSQFLQNFANRGAPVTYSGGTPPPGMNSADAATLQGIYAPSPAAAPAKAVGGFVSPGGFAPQEPQHFAAGGMPDSSEMASWATRAEARGAVQNSGLFNSSVPGRTDKLDTLVPGGSYVVPADVVSGLGEGNTMAGSAVLDKMFNTMPFGMKAPHIGRGGPGIPGAPAPYRQPRAAGGAAAGGHVPIIAAGGEYLVHPDAVKRLGKGDIKKGHKILDHFVVHARKQTAAEMNRLPGPKR